MVVPKVPWWARLEGGREAIESAAAYSQSGALRNLWLLSNKTRLQENPDLFSAVTAANVPYGVARRLDAAVTAESALKSKQILEDAGIPPSQMDPRVTTPAKAAEVARKKKQEEAEQGGSWFTNLFKPITSKWDPGNWAWDFGKGVVEGVGDALDVVNSPVAAPIAAGQADRTQVQAGVLSGRGPVGRAAQSTGTGGAIGPALISTVTDFGVGAYRLATGDIGDKQKEDMRAAGYDPDSFFDRYGWYADLNDPHERVAEHVVAEAKQEFNPHKVDLAREIVASGAVFDQSRVPGLPEDAQRLFNEVRSNNDPEGAQILEKLIGRSNLGPGANLADQYQNMLASFGVETDRDSGWYKGAEAVGDLAAYWYADPLVGAAGALKLWRQGKWAVDVNPIAVKDAIVNHPKLSKRYDDILDRIDKIHVLGQSKRVEDQVAAAREAEHFRQRYADMMPFYDTLLGMRQGSIRGSFFRAPDPKSKLRDIADLKANMIGIERVDKPKDFKPIFELRKNPTDEVSDEARAAARAEIADRIGDAILADAVLSGRPLVKNKLVMPGQIRVSYPLRAALRPFTDKAFKENGLLFKQLKDAEGKGVIDWHKADRADSAVSGVIDSAEGGKWVRDNYTRGGIRSKIAYATSRFALARDAAVLKVDGPDTTKTYYDFVRFLLPRGQAAFLANQWAKADPATRTVMKENMFEMMANARHVRDTPAARDFWNQQLKARESVVLPGQTPKEAYSTPELDQLQTPAGEIRAAMWSTQFADGTQLPSFLEIARNTERVGVLSWLAGTTHGLLASRATRGLKIGQVGTPSNAMRQGIESRTIQLLDDPQGAVRTTLARIGLAGNIAAERAATNRAIRQAKQVLATGINEDLAKLYRFGDSKGVAKRIKDELGEEASPVLLGLLASGAKLDDIAKARSAFRLAATQYGGVDWLRTKRAKLYGEVQKKTNTGTDVLHALDWTGKVDTEFAEKLSHLATRTIGGNLSRWMDGAQVEQLEQIADGIRSGQRLELFKLANTHDYLGAAGDIGAVHWANALNQRLTDPVGDEVVRAVAKRVVQERDTVMRVARSQERAKRIYQKKTGGELSEDSLAKIEAMVWGREPRHPEGAEVARKLLKEDARGEVYRLEGRKAQYHDGKYLPPGSDRTLALNKWAEDMAKDVEHYLGLKPGFAAHELPKEQIDLLRKLAYSKPVSADDLARVPDDFRPDTVHAPVIIGKQFVEGGDITEKVANLATRFYQFVVVRPLQRMVNHPQVIAAHREVMDAMEPLAKSLSERGMSHQNIYNLLQTGAFGHAINRVTRYADNPQVASYFAALSNNFLWYERAVEDFVRRAMTVTKADPAILARANLMVEAGLHSGIIKKQVTTDDEGNQETEYVFTYPGSGLMMRAVNEAAIALGLTDTVKIPVWQDFTSPVRYLSPSLQNPLGFTTTPLVGLPLRVTKEVFPQTAPAIDNVLTTLEGGERQFGSQNAIESILPVHLKRLVNMLDPDDRTSQFMSSFRNALAYLNAAGKLPGPNASKAERQQALDDVATMVQNNLVFRTVFATFTPATPGSFGSNISGIGDDETNVIDRARGVNTIRGEFFQLLEEYANKYPDPNQAYSEAMVEWLRRGHKSILNPESFTVGSSGQPGDETGRAMSSGQDLTQWMLSHQDFMSRYGEVAYSLLPTTNDPYYDQIGYRLQLKNGLRQHKTGSEFYEDLSAAMAWRDYNKAVQTRDEALSKGYDQRQVKAWFSEYTRQLETANPIWAEIRGQSSTPEYVAQRIAPALRDLVADEELPAVIEPHRDELRLMSELYDEYQAARSRASSRQERINLAIQYGERGDSLFKGGPVSDLWSRMKVWED